MTRAGGTDDGSEATEVEAGPERRDLTRQIVELSEQHGFDRCAVAPVETLPAALRLGEWLGDGMHGSMEWMVRSAAGRSDPRQVLAAARSVIVVALNYRTDVAATDSPTDACISRYAWGDEYHRVLGDRLDALFAEIRTVAPEIEGRWYVDTGPVMEKAWAERAGLGWIGKHANVISRDLGSWIFLGAIIVDVDLHGGEPHRDYCGTCTACIDACPTDAIVAPYVVDARRCISYLTIENRGAIPVEYRRQIGNRVFGCDDCQDVCPWNRFARASRHAQAFEPRPLNHSPALVELLALSDEEFRLRFKDSPVLRAKRRGLARNVAIALGNSGDASAVGPLVGALADSEALVRSHAAWALGELGGSVAEAGLEAHREREDDDEVIAEIDRALGRLAAVLRGDDQSPDIAS